jgi:hypothetical protein
MSAAQLRRDKRAVLAVLGQHQEPITYAQIALQGGEGLLEALWALKDEGLVRRRDGPDNRGLWSLRAPVDTLPKGRNSEGGSVRSKGSAVPEGQAPKDQSDVTELKREGEVG